MVSIGVFLVMGTMLLAMVSSVLNLWRASERRRVQYSRAQLALTQMIDDLTATVSREPIETNLARIRFLCLNNPSGPGQILMFVRSYEQGPERVHTFAAGADLAASEIYDNRDDDQDGFIDNNLRPLGGMAEIVYYLQGRTLMRGIRAPVQQSFLRNNVPLDGAAQPLIGDVLYLGFRFWTQYSKTWNPPAPKSKSNWASRKRDEGPPRSPVDLWDSTRGYTKYGLGAFPLHLEPSQTASGRPTVDFPDDDVFPEIVEITLVVEGEPKRATKTQLTQGIGLGTRRILVESTRGFPDVPGGSDDGGLENYFKIGSEWIRYKAKHKDSFIVAQRGARRTTKADHAAGETLRVGKTFTVRVYIPAHKEDWNNGRGRRR